MIKIKIIYFLLLVSIFNCKILNSKNIQNNYLLHDIIVTGTNIYNKNEILNLTGLELNKPIELNNKKINIAIKKLWETQLFSNVEIFIHSIKNSLLILKIHLSPFMDINEIKIKGIPENEIEELKKYLNITDTTKLDLNFKNKFIKKTIKFYEEKGFPYSKILVSEKIIQDSLKMNLNIFINPGNLVKIKKILFKGNKYFTNKILESTLEYTKKNNFFKFWEVSKFFPEKFKEDLDKIINKYKSHGFLDIKIINHSLDLIKDSNYQINIEIEEGKQYFLGDIKFYGNSKYSSNFLHQIFNFKTGDIYNKLGILKKISNSEKDDDILTLYLNNGYFFCNINLIEKSILNNIINIDIIINEGKKIKWKNVTFSGNNYTHDHVIQRIISTLPGDFFSKEKIKKTYFDLASIPYIESEKIEQNITSNIDNTLDINWKIQEKESSQIQLQGGYGSRKLTGTVSLSFNNFSIKNLFNINNWNPIPLGDGQNLTLQAQIGKNFQNYSINFLEPWIIGKNPTSFSIYSYVSIISNENLSTNKINFQNDTINNELHTFNISLGLNKLLSWPDNWFRLSNIITIQMYKILNYPVNFGFNKIYNGHFNNFNYNLGISRNSYGIDPIFPTSGSEFDFSVKFTLPYSLLFNQKNQIFQNSYKMMEYYKIKFKTHWYRKILENIILQIGGEFGILNQYNKKINIPIFEKFFLGGINFSEFHFDGRENISLRGYENASHLGGVTNQDLTPHGGGLIYNKFIMEIRYPFILEQTRKIYALTFLEGGNIADKTYKFSFFDLKRSFGLGIRFVMPPIGIIGVDCAYGFDKMIGSMLKSKWHTHFIIGQQF